MRPLGATPTTHILKLPIGAVPRGIDLSTSVENEWLCTQILKAYGLPVAECAIERFGAQQVLVVERFDRRLADDGSWFVRLPQEDLCQATATPPSRRYENEGGPGIRSVMELLLGSSAAATDRANFLRAQLVFWLLCGIDGHAKNFSVFLEAGGGYRLTPFYDVLSAYPVIGSGRGKLARKKVKLAMAVEGKNRHYLWDGIVRRHWNETARRCGFARDAESLVEELIARTPAVVEQVQARMPKGFPRAVAQPIFGGLRSAASRLASQPSG
jgi:serine/threonine-protein kinase HipA